MSFLKPTQSIALLSLILLAGCDCGLNDKSCQSERHAVSEMRTTDSDASGMGMGAVDASDDAMADKDSVFASGDKVYYGFDKYTVDSAGQKVLEDQASWLNANPEKTILVEGRCDERGTREYNLALGERRANSAKNYLIALGVNGQRISTVSYGKDKPLVLGSNPEAWALNRSTTTKIEN